MSSLYEIDNSLIELLENGFNENCVDKETGEIDFSKAQKYLDELSLERNKKLENIALYVKNLESEADAIKQEENNLKARREAKENRTKKLREYLKNSLLAFNQKTFETPKVSLSFRTSKSIEIDAENLDKKFLREKVEYTPDKKAIKEAIESGYEIVGASIKENQNLQIK